MRAHIRPILPNPIIAIRTLSIFAPALCFETLMLPREGAGSYDARSLPFRRLRSQPSPSPARRHARSRRNGPAKSKLSDEHAPVWERAAAHNMDGTATCARELQLRSDWRSPTPGGISVHPPRIAERWDEA